MVKILYTDQFVLPLPPGHPFPMEKYALLRQRVAEAGLAAWPSAKRGWPNATGSFCNIAGVPESQWR